jgi:hypothetical protein
LDGDPAQKTSVVFSASPVPALATRDADRPSEIGWIFSTQRDTRSRP